MEVWIAVTLLFSGLTVTLRDLAFIGSLTWPKVGAVGIANCQRLLAVAFRCLS